MRTSTCIVNDLTRLIWLYHGYRTILSKKSINIAHSVKAYMRLAAKLHKYLEYDTVFPFIKSLVQYNLKMSAPAFSDIVYFVIVR